MFRRNDRAAVRAAALLAGAMVVLGQAGPLGAQAPAVPAARQLLDRHVKEIGGAEVYKSIKTMHARGTLSMPAQQISGSIEIFAARPNRQVLRMDIAGVGKAETGYDGKHGWSLDPVTGPTLMTGRQLAEMVDSANFDSAIYLAADIKDATTIGRETFDKREAYRVKLISAAGIERFEFFDVQTGLQIGTEARRQTPLGVVPVTTYVRDYKPFNGMKIPTSLVQTMLGFDQVMTISSYEFNTLNDEVFVLPPQIKALIKRP
jgi:zinc protease